MIVPTYTPYSRKFTDPQGNELEIIFAANNHGTVVYWVSAIGIVPVAKVSRRGKVALLQRPKTNPTRAPMHLYHGLLRLQALNVIPAEEMDEFVDIRHREPVVPQTLHEAKSALDKIIPAVVSELDFICLSDANTFTTPREAILHVMSTTCKERYVPRRSFNLVAEIKEGPVTPVEQTIMEHITHGLYFADGEPLDGDDYSNLISYIREKIEVVLTEMNGALGE